MPRIKKQVNVSVSGPPSNLTQSLTAGRSRRTIKPNPRYLNDEMVVPTAKDAGDSFEGSDMSEEDYEMDDDELEQMVVRKSMASSTSQQGTGQKRRGRPPKPKIIDGPRTEPIKNLRKEVLKKMDYKTISISKSRHSGTPIMRDSRRKLEMSVDSIETDSADQDELDEMEEKQDQFSDCGDGMDQTQKVLNSAAFKKHLAGKTILERRGSGANKSSADSKVTGETSEEEEDDDDFFNDSDPKMSQTEQVVPGKRPVGRPRKHAPKQQISRFAHKVLLPGMKNAIVGHTLKRKVVGNDNDENAKHESQQSKMLRRSYGLKHVNSENQSMETESDDNEDEESDDGNRKALQRARSFPTLPRGPGRAPKNSYYMSKQKQKQMEEHSSKIRKLGGVSLKSPTITYVNVKDIMKKSKSSFDIRRKIEEDDSEEVSELEELKSSSKDGATQSGERPKTNNQLVATILERKRPIAIENLHDTRRRDPPGRIKKERSANNRQSVGKQQRLKDLEVTEILTENDIVDFEDMLQKNIVSANKGSRMSPGLPVRGRGRPSENSQSSAKQTSKTNNNLYKSERLPLSRQSSGGMGVKRSLQPPRILNTTMKLGNNRTLSKLSATSGNNHYSIDLTDPDNNVKLISSAESSPGKRTLTVTGGFPPSVAGTNLRATPTIRPGMMRENQRVSTEFKKKKITCYERWHVINCKFNESPAKKQFIALSMIGLGNVAGNIKMPSDAWSLRTVLEKRKTPPGEGDEIFTGEMHDNMISDEDKANYEPSRIMFRRKAPTPGRFNVQYDRTVIFRNDCYTVNVDGQGCRLVAAPLGLETVEDIELLLSIVDYIDLKSGCIELISPIRTVADSGTAALKRIVSSKDVTVL